MSKVELKDLSQTRIFKQNFILDQTLIYKVKDESKFLLKKQLVNSEEKLITINTSNSLLALYTKADVNSPVKTYISVGEILNLLKTENNFYKVKFERKNIIAYIPMCDVKTIESNIHDPLVEINEQGYIVNTASNVSLKKNAAIHSLTITHIDNNSIVNVIAKKGSWYKVSYKDSIGYIYQDFISLKKSIFSTEEIFRKRD